MVKRLRAESSSHTGRPHSHQTRARYEYQRRVSPDLRSLKPSSAIAARTWNSAWLILGECGGAVRHGTMAGSVSHDVAAYLIQLQFDSLCPSLMSLPTEWLCNRMAYCRLGPRLRMPPFRFLSKF